LPRKILPHPQADHLHKPFCSISWDVGLCPQRLRGRRGKRLAGIRNWQVISETPGHHRVGRASQPASACRSTTSRRLDPRGPEDQLSAAFSENGRPTTAARQVPRKGAQVKKKQDKVQQDGSDPDVGTAPKLGTVTGVKFSYAWVFSGCSSAHLGKTVLVTDFPLQKKSLE